jgi:hypothetical protein
MQCAGTMAKVKPEYRKMNTENSRLGIILLNDNMAIANPNDIAEYIGNGDTKPVFSEFFTAQLTECAEQDGNFAEVAVASVHDTSGFIILQEQLSRENQVRLRVPAHKAFPDDSAHYLLILDNIEVSREKNPGKTVVVGGMYGIPTKRTIGELDILKIKGTFALWDNVAGKTAAFGLINVKSDVLPAMTQNSWIDIIQRISTEIFINQPYGMQSSAP